MQTYIVLRRGAWETTEELDDAGAVASRLEEEELAGRVKLIRSYTLEEEDGTLGTADVYQAEDEDALLELSQYAELPVDEVIPVLDTQIIRDDP